MDLHSEPKLCAHLLCNHAVEHPGLGPLCDACRLRSAEHYEVEIAPSLLCCSACDNDCEDYL